MKVLICDKSLLVAIANDEEDFDMDTIKKIYGANSIYEEQYLDLSIENFKDYSHDIVDGKLIIKHKEPEPIVPEPTLEEKINLQIAQNSAETLEVIATLNEMQKVEQAQSNAEMIELILSLQGGM